MSLFHMFIDCNKMGTLPTMESVQCGAPPKIEIDFGPIFDENSTVTQIVNLQPMLVKWTNSEGVEGSNFFYIDFYNEKVYDILSKECQDSLIVKTILFISSKNTLSESIALFVLEIF